jgi:dTDP-4-amino-4,6-dideoxy-D-galactose acyltransferase
MSSITLRAANGAQALGASAKRICERLPWDSEFFGINIARLWGQHLPPERAVEALRWCREQNVQCLYFLADASDALTARSAHEAGFRMVDVRTTYECNLAFRRPVLAAAAVRPFERDDLPALERIAAASHTDSRFYFDGRFDRQRCGELYATWIRRSCAGWADAVFTAGFAGAPVGYITCHVHDGGYGSIGLIAVDPESQGGGLGQQLVATALGYLRTRGIRRVEVVTQGRNIRSQQLYQRSGFSPSKVEIWYHLWPDA